MKKKGRIPAKGHLKKVQGPSKKKLFSGTLNNVCINEDGTLPVSYKEYKSNFDTEIPAAKLTRGNIISKTTEVEKHVIFDYRDDYYDEQASFKIFLYDDGVAAGKISYPLEYDIQKQSFKGSYKIDKLGKLEIWGVWALDKDFKQLYPVYIELQ